MLFRQSAHGHSVKDYPSRRLDLGTACLFKIIHEIHKASLQFILYLSSRPLKA